MKLVFCIGARGEMLFNQRRVSRDRSVITDLAELVGDSIVYMDTYSEELFEEASLNIICSPTPANGADKDDFVFIERENPEDFSANAEMLVIYNFNRTYPSDLSFTAKPEALGFSLSESKEFAGDAHDKITRMIYSK